MIPAISNRRLNTSTLIIGETKAGKTTLLATLAEYLWEEHQKVLFLFTCGLGGFSARVEQRCRQGLIRPFRLRTRDDRENSLSFETLQLASKGYVPAAFTDAQAGEVAEGCRMVPPVQRRFAQTCQKCNTLVRDTTVESLLRTGKCPTCATVITLQNSNVRQYTKPTAGFEQIGTFAYDDLTSASDWYLQDMSHRKLGGEKDSLGGSEIVSGDSTFRGNNRAQVGMAQTRAHELVANSLGIPNLVMLPTWIALSEESMDETGQLPIVGVKLAGSAKTYIAGSWFGNCLEAVVEEGAKPGEKIRRLYLDTFIDQYNRRHLVGHRGDPRFMPSSIEDAPYDDQNPPTEYCTGFSLNHFFRLLEQSVEQGRQADSAFEGPAIPTGYGDAEQQVEAPQARVGGGAPVRKAPARPAPKRQVVPPAEAPAAQEEVQPAASAAETTDTSEGSTAEAAGGGDTSPSAVTESKTTTDAAPQAAPPVAPARPKPAGQPPKAPPTQQAAGQRFPRPAGSRPPAPRAPQAGPGAPSRPPGQS